MSTTLLMALLRRHLGLAPTADVTLERAAAALRAAPAERLAPLLDDIARSYADADAQNERLHRALAVSTLEAEELAAELRRRQAAAESARHASEERFRAIMDLLPDIVSVIADDGTLLYNSPACTRIHGWRVDELLGRRTFDLVHPADRAAVTAALADIAGTRGAVATARYRYRNKDGSYVWMEAIGANHRDDAAVGGVIAVSRDIRERHEAEARLRESEARYKNLADLLPIPVFEADLDGRLLFANEALAHTFGRARARGGAALLDLFDADAKAVAARHVGPDRDNGAQTDELVGLRADGTSFPVALTSAPIRLQERLVGVRGAMVDLTDRNRVQAEMVRAQRLESIGLLAGGIAHDFNNILTGIRGNVSLAHELATEAGPLHDLLVETERATERAAALTRPLLTFARGGAPTLRPVAVARLCREVTAFALRGSPVDARFDLPADLPDVIADAGQLAQAISNLVINAREAMPAGGTLEVAAEVAPGEAGAGPSVIIRVTDAGPGIPEELLPRIFDPYVTTKASGHGLGLASAYSIVHRHRGELRVRSRPGHGATFEIVLPAALARAAGVAPAPTAETPRPRLAGRVLVMDDEAMICRLVAATLERVGLEVDTFVEGAAALAAFERAAREGRAYDLAILDLTVPGGLGGREVAEALRARHPEARLVVSSGYSDDPVMADYPAYGFAAAVPKPFAASNLVAVVRALLT